MSWSGSWTTGGPLFHAAEKEMSLVSDDATLTAAWDDIDPDLPLSERMLKLEAMMRAFRDSEAAATYLKDSVERLGLNATALGEALLQVDRNQQTLTNLGKQLDRVAGSTPTKTEVEAKHHQLEEFTKASRRNLFLQMMAGLAFLTCVVLYMSYQDSQHREVAYKVCQDQSEQNTKVGVYLADAVESAKKRPGITPEQIALIERQAAQLREAFPPVSCEGLAP